MMNAQRYVHRSGVLVTDLGDEVLLCGADRETIHVLNPVARRIWELCDGKHTPEEMERVIRTGFSVADDRDVLADVQQTLKTLATKGLIEPDGYPQ